MISYNLSWGAFQAPKVGLLFGPVSLGPPFAKSQKMGDLGVLAELVITRHYGHFWSCDLHRDVVRFLHFKSLLKKVSCNLRLGVFQARKVGLFLG